MTIRVILADDHRILREGLRSVLEMAAGVEVVDLELAALVFEGQAQPAAQDVNGLVLLAVELQRQALAGANGQELSQVAFGDRPDVLVSPGFFDAAAHARDRSMGRASLQGPGGRPR